MTGSIPEEELAPLRKQIDHIDSQILDLINQRLNVGRKVGDVKKEKGSQVLDRSRERQVIENLLQLNQGPAQDELLTYIFNVIITATRDIQKPKTISYFGPLGSFSHVAALNHFCHSGRFLPQGRLRDVFQEVEKQESACGVVPVENSLEGTFSHTLDLFTEFGVRIVGEEYASLTLDLLSITGDSSHAETIVGEPGTLEQCRGWLRRKFKHVQVKEAASSLQAVEMARTNPDLAAVVPGATAAVHGLLPVETQIQDASGNITRYLILGQEEVQASGQDKTSIMFAASHVPGALLKALKPVEETGVNMLKLESRPTRKENWQYYFFLDLEGHASQPQVAETIEAIRERTLYLRVLGSYPMATEKRRGA